METTLFYYHNGNWNHIKDRFVVVFHYLLIKAGFRLYIDAQRTAERLKLINEDETHIIYVKKNLLFYGTHSLKTDDYRFNIKIGAKVFSEQFDLKNHFHATNIMPNQIGITDLDDFMKKAGDMVNAVVDYVEQNS